MFCTKCGAPVADGAKFCEKCGAPIATAETETETETANAWGESTSNAWGAETNETVFSAQTSVPVAPRYSGKGIAGFVLSLVTIVASCISVWIALVTGIVGLVLSAMGLKEIKNNANVTGKGMALAGLIISIVMLACFVLLIMIGVILGVAIAAALI